MYKYKAVVRRVIDGDTVVFDIDKGFRSWQLKEPIRFANINTPEIRGKERAEGLIAKAFVEKMLPKGSEVLIKTEKEKPGKYGRWIATVYFNKPEGVLDETIPKSGWVDLNTLLVKKNLAKYVKY